MTETPPSVSLVGATTSKCKSVRSMPWVQGFQEAIKLWGEMVFKCGSLGVGLIMNIVFPSARQLCSGIVLQEDCQTLLGLKVL